MFFDASGARRTQDDDVVKTVEKLFRAACRPTPRTGRRRTRRRGSSFRWGGLTGFLAYVESVQAKYTLFTADGLPIRAVVHGHARGARGRAAQAEPDVRRPGAAPRARRRRTATPSPAIAYAEYGDAALWRAVADVNRVDDPMRLRPGQRLLLPTAEELCGPPSPSARSRLPVPGLPAPAAARGQEVPDAAR